MIEKLKNRRNLVLLIAAAVLVVAIVVVVLVCVLSGDSPVEPVDGPSSPTTSTTTSPTSPTTPEPEPPVSIVPENGVIDEVEGIGSWLGTGIALHAEKAPVGNSWLAAELQDAAGAALLYRSFVPALDLTSYSDGYLHMWIYIEDITRVLDGQVELTSSGDCDNQELSWNVLSYAKKSGWNEVYLPLGSANRVGGEINLSACNFMRVYIVTDGSCVLGIDSLQVTNEAPPAPSRVDENGEFVIDEVESLAGWYGTPWELLRDGAPRGHAYLSSLSRDGDAYVLCQDLAPIDIREYKNGYLHVWIYMADPSHLVSGEVELSSAGVSDTNETSWDLLNYVTESGWNELYLPLADAKEVGGSTDFSAVNYLRIYFVTDADTTVGVDYISLSKTDGSGHQPEGPGEDEPTLDSGDLDEQGEFVLDVVEKLAPWQGKGLTVIREGQAKGNAFLGSQRLDGDAILFARGFSDLDIRNYRDGYLHMWLYITDIDQITGGQIELCSGNEADSGETSWNLLEIELQNGWNELYLPIREGQQVGGGTDFSKLNYMRVYVLSKTEQLVGLDYITLTTTAPEKPDPIDPDGNYILDPIRSIYPWQGSPMAFHTANGYEAGAIWISSTRQQAGDIEFFRTFLPMDLSAYQDGSLHLWVYVDDLSKVTGGMVEITSSGTVDNAEISWPLKPYLKQSGWNEIYLPIADGVPEGADAFDISAANAMRVVVGTDSAITAGIDNIYASHTVPEPGKEEEPGVLDPVDSLGPWSGTGLTLETAGGHTEGADWIRGEIGSAGDVFFFRNFAPAKDVSEYQDGSLRLFVYVDDLSKVTGGMVEITSSGTVDNAEISWPLRSYLTQDGWNELLLPVSDGVPQGEDAFDITSVNCIRVVVMLSEAGSAGIDEISATTELPEIDTEAYDQAVEEAYTRSLIYLGADNNQAAIAAVLQKAQNGEPVTLVVFGDSITAGAVAAPGNEWGALVRDWLEALDGDTANGNVTLVNAGIGSTEGVFGVTRLERDVLSHDPDLVIVDFGTNDYGLPYGPEAYEGILTKLLQAGVATINSNVCPQNGNNIQDSQTAINQAYGVPQISFRSAYYDFSLTTDIAGLRDVDIWSSDQVHPTDQGHKLYADLLIKYLQREILDKAVQPGTPDSTLPESVTDNGFDDAVLVENFTETEHAQVRLDGWTADYSARIYQLSTEGWQTSTVGSSLTFDVDGGYFYLFFALTPQSGDLEIRVDGVLRQTIDWAYLGTGYMNVQHVLHLGAAGPHEVVLTLKDNPNVENDWFGICAAGVSNFDGVAGDTLVLDPVEETTAWFGDKPFVIETADGPTASWMSTTRNAAGDAVFCRGFGATDISGYDYLHVWVYIPDLDTATQAWLELSSNGGNLINHTIRWNVLQYAKQDGWNELYLPLSEAQAVGTDSFTPLALDLLRLYVGLPDDASKAGIDDLYMTNTRPEPPVDETLVLDPVEETTAWFGDKPFVLETADGPTASWMSTTRNAAGDAVFCRGFAATDISGYDYLHLWVYIPDLDTATQAWLELSSNGGALVNYTIRWNVLPYAYQDGWNELYLPLSAAEAVGANAFDPTALDMMRLYVGLPDDTSKAGIDDLYMTNTRPEPPVDENLVLDPVEAVGSWIGSAMTLETTGGYTDGADWLKVVSEAGDIVYSRAFTPIDLSAYSDGYLHLWVYVDDISQVTGGMIEITSSGTVDEEELYWNLLDYVTQSGWNELYLPLDTALTQGTRPFVPSNFNCIRIVVMHSGPIVAGIDELSVTNTRPDPEPPVDDTLVLDPVEETTAWFGDKPFVLETADGPTASWMSTTRNVAGDAVFCRGFAATDISGYDYLHVWVYIPDLDTATQAWLELSSNGGALVNYTIRWNVLPYAYQDGWNELYLPLSEAEAVGANAFDPTALDMMRLYVGLPDDASKAGIDDLYMTNERPEPPVDETLVLDPVEETTAWFGDKPFVLETADGPTASWMSTTRNVAGDAVFCRGFAATDISGYDYLHLWVYIPDLDTATQAWLELSSNGGALVNYTIRWNVLPYAYQDGWNELYLPLSEAEAVGANAFDPTALDMMRLYVGLPDDTSKAGIDDLFMTNTRPEPPVDENLVLDPVEAVGSWIGSAMTLETTGGYADGADWLKVVSEAGDIVYSRAFTPTDLSAYSDGYLHLWVYVDDISQVTGGMIEITSSGTVDEEELYWNLLDYVTQSGWNELYLPLDTALTQGTRPFVPSNFNCIRIVVMHSGPIVAGIDELSVASQNGSAQNAVSLLALPDRRQVDFWETDVLSLPEIV